MNQFELPEKLVLFDGECNFCDLTVRFLLYFNKTESLFFSSLKSKYGKFVIENFKIQNDSIVYVVRQKVYTETDAIFLILDELSFIFQVFKIFKIFPKPILNFLYRNFARYRYKMFGKNKDCKVLPPKFQKRFLS